MEMDLIFRIAGVGIIVAILNQILSKAERDDVAMLVGLAGVLVVLMMLVPEINSLFSTVRSVFSFY
jgi:stage III sporulation protein AC